MDQTHAYCRKSLPSQRLSIASEQSTAALQALHNSAQPQPVRQRLRAHPYTPAPWECPSLFCRPAANLQPTPMTQPLAALPTATQLQAHADGTDVSAAAQHGHEAGFTGLDARPTVLFDTDALISRRGWAALAADPSLLQLLAAPVAADDQPPPASAASTAAGALSAGARTAKGADASAAAAAADGGAEIAGDSEEIEDGEVAAESGADTLPAAALDPQGPDGDTAPLREFLVQFCRPGLQHLAPLVHRCRLALYGAAPAPIAQLAARIVTRAVLPHLRGRLVRQCSAMLACMLMNPSVGMLT